jgi:signal transduction histidine kinase
MEKTLCLDSEATLLGFFDPSIAPTLLYYAYVPIIIVSLLLGYVVYRSKNNFHLPNKLFFTFCLVYIFYLTNEIIQWIAVPAGVVHFAWEIIALFFIAIPIILLYFVYTFLEKKDLSFNNKLLLVLLSLPILIFLPTTLNTEYFDLALCQAEIGRLDLYLYFVMILCSIIITFIGMRHFLKNRNWGALYLAFGAVSMLLILLFADYISETLEAFEFNLIGPVGMLIFMTTITYMIVKMKAFNMKIAGVQALTITLLVLVGSLLFVVKSDTSRIIAIITLVFTTFAGYFLVRSVKKEIQQREQLEILTGQLEAANNRLKELDKAKSEFVSIASHQLRSPLTAIRGYASMLVEGSFGQMPQKAQEAAKRIEDSTKLMAMSIEDYLNVSRIESGNMKYNLSDFNLYEMTSGICDDLRPEALKQNLILLFRSDITSKGMVNADVGKTHQIIHNLINNSIKYTQKGSISVFVREDIKAKRIYIDISDTGIGMSQKTIDSLFQKFSRADNANSVNTSGTGLGLYVAVKMAEAMGGSISARSEGDGKGSTFTFELPLKV